MNSRRKLKISLVAWGDQTNLKKVALKKEKIHISKTWLKLEKIISGAKKIYKKNTLLLKDKTINMNFYVSYFNFNEEN